MSNIDSVGTSHSSFQVEMCHKSYIRAARKQLNKTLYMKLSRIYSLRNMFAIKSSKFTFIFNTNMVYSYF